MSSELTTEEKNGIIDQHLKNLSQNKYNLYLTILEIQSAESSDQLEIQNIESQIKDIDFKINALEQEKWVEADECLSKSIKAKNSSPAYAYLGRGIARYNQGKLGLACVDWERSYQLGEKAAKKWLDAHCKEK